MNFTGVTFSKCPNCRAALSAARARLPTTARELQPVELAFAKLWYSNSLVYEDIYVSDAEGVGGRPFTIALPLKKRWIVVLNLGPKGFNDPVASNKATLIHELAHAWQSQHHPDPWQFMVNSMQCRRAAAIGTVWAATQWRYFHEAGATKLDQKEFFYRSQASANAWFPGRRFGQYGGGQIAQQVQDFFFPPVGYYVRPPTSEVWKRYPTNTGVRKLSGIHLKPHGFRDFRIRLATPYR